MNGIADLQIASSAAQQNPRMAAASELVSSEGLEALDLPPATEAALNIQEATNLIDSADQLLAQAGKPTTTTVLEQRQQQVLDGIAGALARVRQSTPPRPMMGQPRPPMMAQQRPPMMGQPRPPMMAQQRPPMMPQQRPPMAGQQSPVRPPMQGVAGMAAPNMARAAQGGIVGFAGEGPSLVKEKPTMGSVPQNAINPDQLKLDADKYQQLIKAIANASTPEIKARNQMLLQELITEMTDDNTHHLVMQYIDSTQGVVQPRAQGMAGGGIVAFAGPDGSVVEGARYQSSKNPEYWRNLGARRVREEEEEERNRLARSNEYQRLKDAGMSDTEIFVALQNFSPTPTSGVRQPMEDTFDVSSIVETLGTPSGEEQFQVVESRGTEYLEEGSDLPFGEGNPTTDGETSDVVEDIVSKISEIQVAPGTSPLTKIVSEYGEDALGRDRTAEEEQRRQDALDFYGLSDRERELRQQAADTQTQALAAELDPEVLRQQKINSILGNLSGPGGIIGAGNRGAAARTAFDKKIRDIEAEKALLPIASELETLGMDRAVKEKAFGAGTELAKNFSAEMNTALQSLANLSSVQMSSETSAAIQNARANITALTTQASNELAKLREKGLNIRDNREYQRRLREGLAEMEAKIGIAMAELEGDTLMNAEQKASAQAILTNSLTAARRQIMGEISRGGSEDPELEAILEQYN